MKYGILFALAAAAWANENENIKLSKLASARASQAKLK